MRRFGITLLFAVSILYGAGASPSLLAQRSSAPVDPNALPEKAKAGIEKNPNSAFWHNQSSIAYDMLNQFDLAVKRTQVGVCLGSGRSKP